MPNKNEREWWRDEADDLFTRLDEGLDIPSADIHTSFIRIIADAEKRERARVLEEVNTMINKHARKEAGNDLLVVPLGIAVLGLVSLQSKDGKGE